MRFIGLVLVLIGLMVSWFFGIQGTGNISTDFSKMRSRLATIFNLPGLSTSRTPPPPPGGNGAVPSTTAASGGSGFGPGGSAGQGSAGGGGGSW